MKRAGSAAVATAALGVAAVVRKKLSSNGAANAETGRWLTVTVNRPPQDVRSAGDPPTPLNGIVERVEVRIRPAPGDRGTELSARPRQTPSRLATSVWGRATGRDPRQEVRKALREAKSVLETGEVMLPDAPPTTRGTPAGRVVGLLARRSKKEGVL